jgi:hypothetical protein
MTDNSYLISAATIKEPPTTFFCALEVSEAGIYPFSFY